MTIQAHIHKKLRLKRISKHLFFGYLERRARSAGVHAARKWRDFLCTIVAKNDTFIQRLSRIYKKSHFSPGLQLEFLLPAGQKIINQTQSIQPIYRSQLVKNIHKSTTIIEHNRLLLKNVNPQLITDKVYHNSWFAQIEEGF